MGGFAGNPFLELPLFRKTRDGRYVVALDFYPRSKADTLTFLRCTDSLASIENAILQWRADDLEAAAAEEGLILAKVRTTEEFLNEPQYTEVLSTMPLITVEKIGDSEPVPFERDGKNPLDGITAETPLGTYQGMTDQVIMSRTKESYWTVLAPHGSSKPHWLVPAGPDTRRA
jgi:hypothetical protein